MRLQGVFLDSRFGRRIVVLFVLAAALPLAVLGALAQRGWAAHVDAQGQRALAQATKASALRVFDRLMVARTLLRDIADSGQALATLQRTPGGHAVGVFRGHAAVGAAAGTAQQQALLDAWAGRRDAGPETVLLLSRAGDAPRIVLAVRGSQHGIVALGEIEPQYLWRDAFAAGEIDRACVATGVVEIHCGGAPPRAEGMRHASWNLFLRHEFGAEDWVFHAETVADADATTLPVGRIAWQAVLAALLLVAVLSLVLVRRTIVPLQRLTDGTRRLAQGDYAVRVDVRARDEFGELGASFNHMAQRIGAQVHEMEVLSSLDRDILDGGDADTLVERALARLGELVAADCVGVARVDAVPGTLVCLEAGPGAARPARRRVVLTPSRWQALTACASGWLGRDETGAVDWIEARRAGAAVYLAPVRWKEQLLALLYVAPAAHAARDAGWTAQVDGLRDRVAVGLGAALRERQLVHRASHDSLTGLLNRAGLRDAIDRAIARARDAAQPFALLFIDLDRFKSVNDAMGHAVGDELLRIVANRLIDGLPEAALLARPGGDEFVAVVPDVDAGRAEALGVEVCGRLGESIALRGSDVTLGASVGIAMYPDDGGGVDALLRHADMAMYAAKARGRGRSARFEASLDVAAMEHARVLRELRHAVPRGELVLHYQARLDTASGRARSVEALVRWNHPERGLLPPGVFIEIAEESGLIVEIGRWVLFEACRQLAAWRREGVRLSHVSVNVSVGQLRTDGLCGDVEAALHAHGLAPTDLEIEVTESLMATDPQAAAARLRRLAATGVRIALDDFGTGYSSMSYLRFMPIDVIKVDRAFVRDLGIEPAAEAVARAVVALASSLGMSLVAEGVETEAQAALLRAMGCQELQGYLYARPLPPAELPGLPFVDVDRSSRDTEVLA